MCDEWVPSATLTDLLRTPKAVIAQADHGAVRITRRDGDDLVMLKADDLDRLRHGVELTAVLVHGVCKFGTITEAIKQQFTWVSLLAEHERMAGSVRNLARGNGSCIWSE